MSSFSIIASLRPFTKTFIGGVERKELLVPSKTLALIGKADGADDVLDEIYDALTKIETEKLDWFLLPEDVYLVGDEGSTDFSRKDNIEKDVLRTWIQLDFDCSKEGSRWNLLTLEEKVKIASELIPALDSARLGLVAQGSNKAWLPNEFPDHLALRIYVRLSAPAKHKQLRDLFSPLHHIVDETIFKKGNPLLACPPTILDEKNQPIPLHKKINTLYRKGEESLDLEKIPDTPDYDINKAKREKLTGVLVNISGIEVKTKLKDFNENWKELEEYWSTRPKDGSRNHIFYELISKAQWVNLSGDSMVEVICSSEKALGNNWDKGKVSKIKAAVDESNRSRLDHSLWNHDKLYKTLPEIDYVDFGKAHEDGKLGDVAEIIKTNLDREKQTVLLIKGTHGSGKTTVVLKEVIDIVEEWKQEACRALYCTSNRATARSMYGKGLGFELYLTEEGKTKGAIGACDDKYITSIFSLPAITENNRGYDIYAEDEVNQISNWASWQNFPYADAHAVAAQAKVVLLMDADVSELVFSRGRMIQELHRNSGLYKVQNTRSYLPLQTLNILRSQDHAYLKIAESVDKEIPTHVHTDRADAIKSSFMSSLVRFANKRAKKNGRKKDIAIGFHANTKTAKTWEAPDGKEMAWELAIHYQPTKFIEYLWELGYRIIVTSPTIINGWRYHSEKKIFKRSIGIYNASTQSYKDICQKLQRFVKCNEHWIYVRPKSTYSSMEATTNLHLMEYFETTDAKYIAKIVTPSATNAILRSRAKAEVEKIKENVLLDLFYYWETNGSPPVVWAEETIEQDARYDVLKSIKETLKQSREEVITTLVEGIMLDENSFKNVLNHFVIIESFGKARPMESTDLRGSYEKQKAHVIKLVDKLAKYGEAEEWFELDDHRKVLMNKDKLKLDDVLRIHKLLHANDSELNELDGKNDDSDEALGRRYSDKRFNNILGGVFRAMSKEFKEYTDVDIVDWVLDPLKEGQNEFIVLKMKDLAAPEFHKIISNYWDVLHAELPRTFDVKTTPDKQISKIAKEFFDIDRTLHHSGNKENTKRLKYALIEKYTKLRVCRKSDGINTKIKEIEKELLNKLAMKITLDETEEDYLTHCNKYVILVKPKEIHKDIYLSLLGYATTKDAIRKAS